MKELVMSKKEKYRAIASRVFDMCSISNYFRNRSNALKYDFNVKEQESYNEFWDVYMEGLEPSHPNNPQYNDYIYKMINFAKVVVAKYTKGPLQHSNGEPFSYDFIERYLAFKEIEDWKIGSKYTCILNEDISVVKISLMTDQDDNWKNHLYGTLYGRDLEDGFDEAVSNFDEGLYEVSGSGERFDIKKSGGELVLYAYQDSKETHPIFAFEHSVDIVDDSDEFEPRWESNSEECPRCKGGGCPRCDASGFFTGIRVY